MLNNSYMNNPSVSGNAVSGWFRRSYSTFSNCNSWNKNQGGVLKITGSVYDHPAIYQNVDVTPGAIYTWSCDLYDYDYAQLDAVNGSNPWVPSLPGFPIKVPNGGWRTLTKNFTAPSSKATVTVFGTRVCVRNCTLIPASCGTPAPTPPPVSDPSFVWSNVWTRTVNVNVTSANTGSFTTRCVLTDIINASNFWTQALSPTVVESSLATFVFSFAALPSNMNFTVGCGCAKGTARTAVITFTGRTLATCQDNITCPGGSKCIDTLDGTASMCSPYLDGAKLTTGSPIQCRNSGGGIASINLPSCTGGDNITVCLGVGTNTNVANFTTTVQLTYGVGLIWVPCMGTVFSPASGGFLTATCLTGPGMGHNLNLSLTFSSPNSAGPVQVFSPDVLSYPSPLIVANTSRFYNQPGNWTGTLVAPNSDAILVAFNVINIAPSSPLLRVFYGPTAIPLQKECTLDRVQSTSTTIVCLTDSTTSYSSPPYQWTVVAGDVSVRGTDTFNLVATFPRVVAASSTGCNVSQGQVFNCPPMGSLGGLVVLSIYGYNFGTNNASVRVFVDGNLCPFLNLAPGVDNDTITCALPAGTGLNRQVFVQCSAMFSSPLPLVSYSPPVITKLCGCDTPCTRASLAINDCPRDGNVTIHLYGTSFGLQGATVLVGSNTCDQVIHDSFSPDTHVTCILRPGSGVHSSVILIQQNGPNSAGTTTPELSFALCPPGTIQHGVSIQCVECQPGTYAPLAGQLECLLCPPGSFTNMNKMKTCFNCPAGKSQPEANQTECMNCTSGRYSGLDGQITCPACAMGTFSNSTGATNCMICDRGSVSTENGATVCELCTPGYFSGAPGQMQCDSCSGGTFSNVSGASECFRCNRGEYIATPRQSSCKLCGMGRYADSMGSLSCINCPTGRYANVENSNTCLNCMNGYYQATPGGIECGRCPPGSVSSEPWNNCTLCPAGKQSASDNSECEVCLAGRYQDSPGHSSCALCAAGRYMDSQAGVGCVLCDPGTIAATEGMAKCTPCPAESTQNGVPPTCWCRASFYMANNTCIKCEPGMDCRVSGLVESSLVANFGYIKVPNFTQFVRCLTPSYCPGNLTTCAPFRTGALCASCVTGYRPVQGEAACGPCPEARTSGGYISGVAILMLVGLTVIYLFVLRTDLHLFAKPDTKPRKWWNGDSGSEDSIDHFPELYDQPRAFLRAETRIKKTLSYQFKIFITFFQLATALLSITSVNWPPTFQYFVSAFDFVNLNFLPWNYVGCVTRLRLFDKIMITSFFPPLFLLIIGGPLFVLLWCCEKRDDSDKDDARLRRARARSTFWRVLVFTMFLCYPAISREIFSYFRCVAVPDGYTTNYFLLASFSEQCYTEQWYQLLAPVIITFLIYPVGIPLLFFWALVRFRDSLRDNTMLYSLGLIYSGYHPEFWWFELLDMGHKLVITCIVALLPSKDGQIIFALVVSALYLLTLLMTMPYLRLFDNLFHMLSQAEIFLLILSMQCGGQVGTVESGSITDVLVSVVLIIIVVAVITAFAILIAQYLRLAYRKKMRGRLTLIATQAIDPMDTANNVEPIEKRSVAFPNSPVARGSNIRSSS